MLGMLAHVDLNSARAVGAPQKINPIVTEPRSHIVEIIHRDGRGVFCQVRALLERVTHFPDVINRIHLAQVILRRFLRSSRGDLIYRCRVDPHTQRRAAGGILFPLSRKTSRRLLKPLPGRRPDQTGLPLSLSDPTPAARLHSNRSFDRCASTGLKTVSLPQNNSSLIPSRRHGFNFDKPPSKRCLAQLVASSIRKAAPLVNQQNGTNAAESAHTRSYRACLCSRNSNQKPGTVGADHLCRSRRRCSSNSRFPWIPNKSLRFPVPLRVFSFCSFVFSTFTSAVPIIVFALLIFVLFALAGVVLLSLALRYRAGTARRRQARRWVTSLNVWMTSFSAVFFLLFTLLLSIWVDSVDSSLDWNGRWRTSRRAWIDADSVGSSTRRPFLTLRAAGSHSSSIRDRRTCSLWLVASCAPEDKRCRWRSSLVDHDSGTQLPGNCCRIDRLLSVYLYCVRLLLTHYQQNMSIHSRPLDQS